MSMYTEQLPNTSAIPRELLTRILQVIQPEKIICFGMRTTVQEAWSCFLQDSETQNCSSYDMLIITKPHEQRPRHELLDIVDSLNTDAVKVNAIIHNAIMTNKAVATGNPFFTRTCNEGLLLHDNHPRAVKQPIEACNLPAGKLEELWVKWFHRAQDFLAGASHFFARGCSDLTAFMLHQAVEHTCIALIRAITGYRPNTHNLRRLLTMTENFAAHCPAVFPRNTKEENRLFDLLVRAYYEARYRESYEVTAHELAILIERVSAFQKQAETLYHERTMNGIGFHQTTKETTYEDCAP